VEDIVVAQLTRSILLPVARGERLDTLALDEIALLLGAHVLQRYGGLSEVPMLARRGLQEWQKLRAEELLRARLDGNITMKELATACSLSVSHFARVFRRSFSMSARQYLIRLRLERAKNLLASTKTPLAEVAALCGFCDQPAFTRAFIKAERLSPSHWRKASS
jgi:transcriptional regulator GlxA family with amidase domain